MKEVYYPFLDERVYRGELRNGLPVFVVKKPGFAKKCAYFATNYGSVHMKFSRAGKCFDTPAGVAHYLEHKMFDMPEGGVMADFSRLGASPNAFTSYDMTAYYFRGTENFEACLRLLLRFVSTPYFTEESVEKERGIIAQEILMCADSPDTRLYEDLFEAMYAHHPARIPIAGSVESIGGITAQTLYDCHRAFYNPANMVLCVVGDVDPERVEAIAEEVLPEEKGTACVCDFGPPEEPACPKKKVCREMDVAMPGFQLGFKCPPPKSGAAGMAEQVIGDLAAEALAGESSSLYGRLYDQGLIDSSFGAGYETLPRAAVFSCGGDSKDPQAVWDAILEEAERLGREGIDPGLFDRLKKSAMGRRIRDLDNFDGLCYRVCANYFDGADYFDFPEIYAAAAKEQAERFLRENILEGRSAMSLVVPRGWRK